MDAGIVVPIAGMVTGIILGLPLVRVAVRYLEERVLRSGSEGAAERRGIDELRARLEVVETMRDRLTDVEERLDFAERMLARSRDRTELPPAR